MVCGHPLDVLQTMSYDHFPKVDKGAFVLTDELLGVIQVTKMSLTIEQTALTQQRGSSQQGCCANLLMPASISTAVSRQLHSLVEQTLLTQGGLVMAGTPFGMTLEMSTKWVRPRPV